MKKYLWFYKFKDVFYKYSIIFLLFLIESKQLACCDKVSINNSKLGGFDFDLEKTLKAHGKIEDTKLRLLLSNHNSNNNLDSNLFSIFS